MKFIDFSKTPAQNSPGKMEEIFPFFPNFFHFGMKRLEPEKIIAAVSHITGARRQELLIEGQGEVGRGLSIEILYRHGQLNREEYGKLWGVDYSAVSVGQKRLQGWGRMMAAF